MEPALKVNEIFRSIQGEGTRAGLPCTMVRLAGCNLRCRWCDTAYAWQAGQERSIEQILQTVAGLACPRVELTGGEPLAQAGSIALLKALCDGGWETLLETNGSLDISAVDPRVVRIVDVKCPSSGESGRNRWENLALLTGLDELKFVIADKADYEFARGTVLNRGLLGRYAVIFSPVGPVGAGDSARGPTTGLGANVLAEWILADRLDVRLGLQLHKILWPSADRGV